MSFLTLINNVQKRAGLEVVSNPTANTDPTVKQLVALANVEGKDLALRHPWSALQKRKAHAGVAAEDQGVLTTLVTDISLQFIGQMTMWNETTDQQIRGPVSRQAWSGLKGRGVTVTWPHFRIYGGRLYITPAPALNDAIAFEYISTNWCQSSGGTGQAAWAADTDTGVLDESLMELGLYWRFLAENGLDYAEHFNTYEARVEAMINADGSNGPLYMSGTPRSSGVYVGSSITRSF
jgi:hypothetical protein